jgi:hypothetical protein
MTVTEFLGCPSEVTRPIQPDKGRTPSRATANTSLDDATMQTLVFCGKSRNQQSLRFITRKMNHDETNDGDDGHDNATSFAQSQSIYLDKWLWRI